MFPRRGQEGLYVFVRDQVPAEDWLRRVAPEAACEETGEYFNAYHLGTPASPQRATRAQFNPFLDLTGVSVFSGDNPGIALYWEIDGLPDDRKDTTVRISFLDAQGTLLAGGGRGLGVPPMEWSLGDTIVEWIQEPIPATTTALKVHLARGADEWQSPVLGLY